MAPAAQPGLAAGSRAVLAWWVPDAAVGARGSSWRGRVLLSIGAARPEATLGCLCPGWVLGVLRGAWQPGWLGTALPLQDAQSLHPIFHSGCRGRAHPSRAAKRGPRQQPRAGQVQAGGRSCHGAGAGPWLLPRTFNNSRWPGTTLSAFIVNEEIIKSILQS